MPKMRGHFGDYGSVKSQIAEKMVVPMWAVDRACKELSLKGARPCSSFEARYKDESFEMEADGRTVCYEL